LYCDVDPVARAVLQFNMKRGLLPKAPIHLDIRELTKPPKADIVVGGSPTSAARRSSGCPCAV
jgi:site-specific DNA-cytosine methylase